MLSELVKWWPKNKPVSPIKVYQFIKPYLQQPFDREAAESMADRLWHQGLKAGIDERDIWIAKVVEEIERLWNRASDSNLLRPLPGCEYIDPDDGTCTHDKAMTPECHLHADCPVIDKPVCAMCGGSGEACGLQIGCCTRPTQKMYSCKYCPEWGPCPDCSSKGGEFVKV